MIFFVIDQQQAFVDLLEILKFTWKRSETYIHVVLLAGGRFDFKVLIRVQNTRILTRIYTVLDFNWWADIDKKTSYSAVFEHDMSS